MGALGQTRNDIYRANAFVRQYDSNGNEMWTHQFSNPVVGFGLAVRVDTNGSIYLSGFTEGVSGIGGDSDAFITKLALLCPSVPGDINGD